MWARKVAREMSDVMSPGRGSHAIQSPTPSCIVHRRETGLVCAGGLAFSIQRVFGSTFG